MASAAFPGSFTTKPPQEPYPSINQTDPAPFPSIPGAPTPPPGGLPLAAIPLTALPTSSVYPQTPKLKQHRQNHTHTRSHACTRPTSSSMLSLIFVSSQHQMHSSVSSCVTCGFPGLWRRSFLSPSLGSEGGAWAGDRRVLVEPPVRCRPLCGSVPSVAE